MTDINTLIEKKENHIVTWICDQINSIPDGARLSIEWQAEHGTGQLSGPIEHYKALVTQFEARGRALERYADDHANGYDIARAALKADPQSEWVENGELLPCPFCTGKADWSDGEQKTEYGNEQVFCTNCLASAPPGADKSEAAEWWNRRGKPCESYADVAEKEIQVLESAFTPAVAEEEKEIFTPPSDTEEL